MVLKFKNPTVQHYRSSTSSTTSSFLFRVFFTQAAAIGVGLSNTYSKIKPTFKDKKAMLPQGDRATLQCLTANLSVHLTEEFVLTAHDQMQPQGTPRAKKYKQPSQHLVMYI